jgi:hypothetical protein
MTRSKSAASATVALTPDELRAVYEAVRVLDDCRAHLAHRRGVVDLPYRWPGDTAALRRARKKLDDALEIGRAPAETNEGARA